MRNTGVERTTDVILPHQARTLAGLFCERVRRSPNAVAYRQFDAEAQRWVDSTWADMGQTVARWQAALSREGLARGERVAVLLRNCREWVLFEQAALGLGLVVIPLYTEDRPENIAYILQNAGVRVLLIGGADHWQQLLRVHDQLGFLVRILSVAPISEATDARLRPVHEWLPPEGNHELHALDAAPGELATIVYTSGTTGRPKGVMLSHGNILWNAHASQLKVTVYTDDLFLSFLPLSHTFERTIGYYLPMMCGSTVAYNRSIPQLGEDLQTIRPSILISVPRIFERVYNKIQAGLAEKSPLARKLFTAAVNVGWQCFERRQGRAPRSLGMLAWPLLNTLVAAKVMAKLGGRLRFAVCGGAPLSPTVARFFIGLGLPLVQGYGLTETSPVIAANTLEDNQPASVGTPLADVTVRVGADNELLTRSPGVMLGYWDNPDATAAMIDGDGWLHTGDQVRIDGQGHIFITGRLKEILVLANGEKVPPADMEMAIQMDPWFEQVMVIGDDRPYLSALIVFNAERWRIEAAKLGLDAAAPNVLSDKRVCAAVLQRVAACIRDFPGYAQIRRVACYLEPWTIDAGTITPTLKLRRTRILELCAERVEQLYAGH
ncbi:MAG: long-chain fatty acid--CoA ligase [Gammaproteobacteria bacterium]|nr:long-chain fatty acid--CoA ligase [Gammaproteobacteria bacterium]